MEIGNYFAIRPWRVDWGETREGHQRRWNRWPAARLVEIVMRIGYERGPSETLTLPTCEVSVSPARLRGLGRVAAA